MTTSGERLRIAVVGSGISGLASAWLLSRQHDVVLFEASHYLGGHTNTLDITLDGATHPVDTGFLVFNDRTYPNLIALFAELGIESHESSMSFSVSVDQGRLEWAGSDLGTVFAQRANLARPAFWGMLRDILRFNRHAQTYRNTLANSGTTLLQLLDSKGYGAAFRHWYLLPMAAAIWSSPFDEILRFPAATFLNFCLNHGLCQISNRPQWRTVLGGGRTYVEKLAADIGEIRLNSPVSSVSRNARHVCVTSPAGEERFDAAVLACHAPQSLVMLGDATDAERQVLGNIRYQKNRAWLHTDARLLPQRESVWSAWNCLSENLSDGSQPVCVSYLINQLQPLPFKTPVIVTLNPVRLPDASKTLAVLEYEHPLFDQASMDSQRLLPLVQGKQRVWFAGAWTRYGFHEDGLRSALKVAADFGCLPSWATLEA